jgi:hypothetical protein
MPVETPDSIDDQTTRVEESLGDREREVQLEWRKKRDNLLESCMHA